MAANYDALGSNPNPNPNLSPYGSGDPYYTHSTGYITPQQPVKKRTSNWIKFGIPVFIIVIVAIVVGVILGMRKSSRNGSSSTAANDAGSSAAASSAASAKLSMGRFAIATDSEYMVPIYPSTVSP